MINYIYTYDMYILQRSIYQIDNLLFYSGHSFYMGTWETFELTRWPALNYFVYLVSLPQIKNY